MILQGLELRLGEGVVVADLGAAQRAGDPEVGEELGGALAGHRRAAVRMQGEHLGLDALLEGRLLGHRPHRTTAGYAHLADGHLVEAAERVGRIIAEAMEGEHGG